MSGKKSKRRRAPWIRFKRFLRRRVRPFSQKFFAKSAGTPPPVLVEEEDDAMEIGLEPGALPFESPFDTQETAQFRVVCYDESGYSLDEFADIDRLGDFANRPGMVWVQMMGMKDPQLVHLVGALFNIPMLAKIVMTEYSLYNNKYLSIIMEKVFYE